MSRLSAWESGKTYAERYARLDVDNVLFSRASGAERVQETARFWLEAWAGREYNRSAEGDTMVFPDVVIPEGEVSGVERVRSDTGTRSHCQLTHDTHSTSTTRSPSTRARGSTPSPHRTARSKPPRSRAACSCPRCRG